jgi:DUF1365 family protein
MVAGEPGLYVGTIRHRRFRPRPHAFEYSIFMALLDIDRIGETMATSRLTSWNRWNLAAFDDRDHLGDPSQPLRARLAASAEAAGVSLPDGPTYLLTHLRYAGFVFNPLSLFYCCDREGRVRAVLAEVNNTFGGRHEYWLRPNGSPDSRFKSTVAKNFYVSPFMEAAVEYEFAITPPGRFAAVHINASWTGAAPGRIFDATLTLERQPWTAANLRRALLRFPFMTTKVVAAIHWEAARLWLKGLPVQPMPQEQR